MPPQNEIFLKRIDDLEKDLQAFKDETKKNNFTAFQEFNKFSSFTSRLKVPHYASLPVSCEAGEIAESSGKLYICSAADTWTVAGTQS